MAYQITDLNQRNAAKAAGFSIMIMAIAAVIATEISIGSLMVADNASETMKNILASPMLFRIGVFSWLIILVCDVLAAWSLYVFFKSVNKNLSLISAWFRLIYVAILGAALVNLIYILVLINGMEYTAFSMEQLPLQVLFYLNAFYSTWAFGLVVFGIHILFLGYLIVKSGFVPKILGFLLMFAFLGYVITNSSNMLFPEYRDFMKIVEMIFFIPMISEVALGIWLLFIGFRAKQAQ